MFKLLFLALLFTVTLSTSVDCTEQALTLTLEEDIAETDFTLEADDLSINRDCLKRKVCQTKCPCGKTVYFEFLPTDPGYSLYIANCQAPKDTLLKGIFNKHFAPLKEAMDNLNKKLENEAQRSGGYDAAKKRDKIAASKQSYSDVTSKTEQLIQNIRKLCTYDQT